MDSNNKGFTIVELLIVVVVIAILAAITIVSYNGIQARTTEAAIQTDMRNAVSKIEQYKVLKGVYPDNSDSATNGMAAVGLSASKGLYDTTGGNFLYCGSNTTANYALVVLGKNGKRYAVGSNRVFSEYTAYAIGEYNSICPDLISSASPRYGYTTTDGWRWING